MPSKKDLEKYTEKYGDIPKNYLDRLYELAHDLTPKQMTTLQENLIDNINTEWKEISFVFWFVPKATPRARYSRFGGHFYVSDAMNNQRLMQSYVKQYLDEFPMIATACEFYCETYFPTPSTMTKEEKVRAELKHIRHLSKPDWDNLGKTYSDMVQNSIILDDSLIVNGQVLKYYSTKPRIEITIRYADRYDSKYNERSITNRKQYKDNIDKIKKGDITK